MSSPNADGVSRVSTRKLVYNGESRGGSLAEEQKPPNHPRSALKNARGPRVRGLSRTRETGADLVHYSAAQHHPAKKQKRNSPPSIPLGAQCCAARMPPLPQSRNSEALSVLRRRRPPVSSLLHAGTRPPPSTVALIEGYPTAKSAPNGHMCKTIYQLYKLEWLLENQE